MSKPSKGIAVDGGCSHNPGLAYYRAVDIATGKELFREDIGVATNNIAEFLGLCHAIFYVRKNKIEEPIYTDSKTAMSWVRCRKANTTFKEPNINNRLSAAARYLQSVNNVDIRKWDTRSFGEIPADFGLK